MLKVFFAYPATPPQLGQVIEAAAVALRDKVECKTWPELDTPGHFIATEIIDRINEADVVLADITRLNFNVCYEIGYAIGKGKRVYPTVNATLKPQTKDLVSLGILDTIGYQQYSNSGELSALVHSIDNATPAKFPETGLDRNAPIFVLDVANKTDASIRMVARIKKSKILFRSFDPSEQSRLSTVEAYRGVAASVAVVVLLLSSEATDYQFNNLRGAFVAGLAAGLEKELLLLQEADSPVPLDYRDLVEVFKQPSDIDAHINELAPRVMEGLQTIAPPLVLTPPNFLADLDFGASAAENEMVRLGDYYLATDHYRKTLDGNVRLVVGRKGSGKTAMFFQVRNKIRSNRKRVVLDLKPEGYQLKHFKESLLRFFGEAVQEHVCKAFWEYVLLLELCHKLLEKDRQVHVGHKELYAAYQTLAALYVEDDFVSEGDFSERMLKLVQRIADDFRGNKTLEIQSLNTQQISELLYKHDIKTLREQLVSYMKLKQDAWILFDNIDKGWPTRGVQASDIVILRGLLDATRDIERLMARKEITVHSVVFLRNDVFELLVDETPDRGKESRVSLDWTDQELLKELLRRRFVANEGIKKDVGFDDIWNQVAVSHIEGEKSADRLIELSLMRPRNLLNLVNYCKSNAVNVSRAKIAREDIDKAIAQYSADLGNEIGLEIRDVLPEARDLLYSFLGCSREVTLKEVYARFGGTGVAAAKHENLLEILLWFSFLGIVDGAGRHVFAYSVFYDMKKLRHLSKGFSDDEIRFVIHPAFWSFLEVATA